MALRDQLYSQFQNRHSLGPQDQNGCYLGHFDFDSCFKEGKAWVYQNGKRKDLSKISLWEYISFIMEWKTLKVKWSVDR